MNRKCPICNSSRIKKLLHLNMIKEKNNPLPIDYDIVNCCECGFTYADVDATQEDYNNYYATFNSYGNSNDIKGLELVKQQMYCTFCDAIEKELSRDAQILDVGCGGGGLLQYFSQRGYNNLYGLDPSEGAVKNIEEHGMCGIRRNIFDSVDEKYMGKFDLVISTAVIEHIYDIHGYIEQLKKYKKKGGYLLLTAPSVEGFTRYLNPIPKNFNQEHINYFSTISIRNALATHGMKVVQNGFIEIHNDEALWVLAMEELSNIRPIERDDISTIAITKYLEQIEKKERIKRKKVKGILTREKIVIWGAGSYTMQLMADVPELEEHVICYIDSNSTKWGNSLGKVKIYSPQYLIEEKIIDDIVICSMENAQDIEQQIRDMGLKNKIIVINI